MANEVSFWIRHRALILFLVCLAVVFGLTYVLRSVLLPFLVGLVFAYLLLPVIKWVEQRLPKKDKWMNAKRVSLILMAYILALALLALFIIYVYFGVRESFSTIIQQAPQYISDGLFRIQQWFDAFRQTLSPQYQQQVSDIVNNLGNKVGEWLQRVFVSGVAFIPSTFGMVAGFISLPFFLFFILKDSESLRTGFYSYLPASMTTHARNIFRIMDNVVGKYIRSELIIASTLAVLVFIGLSILDIGLAPALAVFAGILDFIPVIGPWIAGIFGVLVTLAIAPSKIIWVAIVYILANLLENLLLRPRIQGGFLHINPAILMVLLVLGAYLAGIWGMVLVAPLAALIVEIYKYIRANVGAREVTHIAKQ